MEILVIPDTKEKGFILREGFTAAGIKPGPITEHGIFRANLGPEQVEHIVRGGNAEGVQFVPRDLG